MVYSSKDFESLWFLYQAEGLPKNISIEEFCTKHGVDFPTFDKWYQQERQGEQTTKIIQKIRQRLDKLLADTSGVRGDLMQKALNYLNSFWDQLILYLKDGWYNIDNSLAERTLRPMTVERKKSFTFGSHAGAKVSVIYHTFIETCKMCGVSTLEYFKEFFEAIMQGRTDYENMLPMTIGIKNNKV